MAFTEPGAVLDAVYPAQPLLVAQIRRDVSNIASVFGADQAALLRINLAVSEAATNAILHAYRDREAAGDVHVVVQHEDHRLDVSICDDGIGMSPRADSPGLGLGLGLIAHEASCYEITCGADGGTQVAMRFNLG
ncbi:MAG TPA: ATP-binding protein [Solirubrobacteraceae bacterium]|nr:ATP-binding protein [Solirubrobacteraceae bacterium]